MNIRRKMQQSINFLTCLLDDKNISDNAMNIALNMKTLRSKIMLWINNGEKTFILSKELIEAFKHTDIPLSVSPADFKYPFDTFVIEGEVPLFQTDNGMIDVQSILFTHSRLAYSSGAVIAEPGGKTREKLEWDISISALHDTGPGMGLDHMWLNLSNEKTVEELYHVPSLTALGRNPVQKSEAQLTINMFYNTLMYIHDETRDVGATEVQKTRRMKNETGKKRHKKGYIYLRPPVSYKSLSGTGTGRKIDVRFIVRGHWRNQKFGKGREQSRKIWIMPFWKGPEIGEVASRKYKVK